MTPEVFFDLLFYASSLSQHSSLDKLVNHLKSEYEIDISKQSLDERFTEKTVAFVKRVLEDIIREQIPATLYGDNFLPEFRHVRIKDSTRFNVPSNLAKKYEGSGGSASKAGISIQYEFDLKTGKFLDLNITSANRNDQIDAKETAKNVCEDDILIRDLGYFSTQVLGSFAEKGAFFLSRLHSSITVYDENGYEIDFEKCLTNMKSLAVEKFEMQVFPGKEKLPVRLYIGLVPQSVYAERLRRKQQAEKKRGSQMKEKTKLLLNFNLFITNADKENLPLEKIMPLYSFRWQAELMFKNWKSIFALHSLPKMKEERYTTMLYVRLILIIVNVQFANNLQSMLYKQEKDAILSDNKVLQTLKNNCLTILNILCCKTQKAVECLMKLYKTLSKNHWREKRKNGENFIENILLFICT